MYLFLSVSIAFFLTFILLPIIINVSKSIDLLDAPDRRKIHSVSTPSLGGIGIFIGFMLSVLISISFSELAELKYFLAGIIMIFILGVRDDVSSLQAKHKLAVQILSAVLVVYFSGIKLGGLYGFFGIHQIPSGLAEGLTIFTIVTLTNSFNLIDGIDGLAGSLGVLILGFFGWVFLEIGEMSLAIMCLSVSGALIAFLFFNWHPSKVFMGDTGSMILGFIVAVLSIKVINTAQGLQLVEGLVITSPLALVVGALILPLYDTSRVFTIRLLKGRSPLSPDRNHIHHALLDLGLNHGQASFILIATNLSILSFTLFLNNSISQGLLISMVILLIVCFGITVDLLRRRKKYLGITAKVNANKGMVISKSA